MKNNSNPAQRLYDIAKEGNQPTTNDISINVWAAVFGISPETPNEFTRKQQMEIIGRLNQCQVLINEVEILLGKNREIPLDIYLRPFPKLKRLFCPPFQLHYSHKRNSTLNHTDFTLLELCIHAVDKVYKEKVVDENEMKALLSDIQDLYEQVFDLEINGNLKRILLDMLKIMENAIHEYRIRGVERLREALEQLVGVYVSNKETIENSNIEEVGKVRKLLYKFNGLYSFAADTIQLLGAGEVVNKTNEFITKLLDSGN